MRENLPPSEGVDRIFHRFSYTYGVAPSVLSGVPRLRPEYQPLPLKHHEYRCGSSRKTLLPAGEWRLFAFDESVLLGASITTFAHRGDNSSGFHPRMVGGFHPPGRLRGDAYCNSNPRRRVFLLLYLTSTLILDNRLGLPKKLVSFRAAQTCRPLRHNFKC